MPRPLRYFTDKEKLFLTKAYALGRYSNTTILRAFNREFDRKLQPNDVLEFIRREGLQEHGKAMSLSIAMNERKRPEFKSSDYFQSVARSVL
jgi:hypothetical protein